MRSCVKGTRVRRDLQTRPIKKQKRPVEVTRAAMRSCAKGTRVKRDLETDLLKSKRDLWR
jgi:hypothetical protein